MRHALPCALFVLAVACAETRATDETDDAVTDDEVTGEGDRESTPTPPPVPAEHADDPPFDFRRVRTEPGRHLGEPRVCAVGFADAVRPLEPRHRDRYPEHTTSHRTVRCDAQSGDGWIDVVFSDSDDPNAVSAGRRAVLVPRAMRGGLHDYVIARFERSLGAAPPTEARSPAPSPEEIEGGFDFDRLDGEARPPAGPRPCVIGFVSEISVLEEERRSRLGYPEGTVNRVDVKCLHPGGDSWIDLVFDREGAPRALDLAPGSAISVEILSTAGGRADRPITRWVET